MKHQASFSHAVFALYLIALVPPSWCIRRTGTVFKCLTLKMLNANRWPLMRSLIFDIHCSTRRNFPRKINFAIAIFDDICSSYRQGLNDDGEKMYFVFWQPARITLVSILVITADKSFQFLCPLHPIYC